MTGPVPRRIALHAPLRRHKKPVSRSSGEKHRSHQIRVQPAVTGAESRLESSVNVTNHRSLWSRLSVATFDYQRRTSAPVVTAGVGAFRYQRLYEPRPQGAGRYSR